MKAATRLKVLSVIVVLGLMASIVWALYLTHLHYTYPYNTFLFRGSDRFMDFFNSYNFLKVFTYINEPLNTYFPFTFWAFAPLIIFNSHTAFYLLNAMFFIFIYYFMFVCTQNVYQKLNKKEYHIFLFLLIVLSLPFLYCIDRGNIEILMFIFLAGSILLFSRERYKAAAILLACATGLKFIPAIFALLFIKKRRYKELALFVVLTLIITVGALLTLHGGFDKNLAILLQNMANLSEGSFYMGGIRQSGSVMAVIKALYVGLHSSTHILTYSQTQAFILKISPTYSLIAFIVIALFSLYILMFEDVFWKQVMILTLLMIMLPAISYAYKFIHLFIPLAFFLGDEKSENSMFTKIYVILFAILLIPKNYHIFALQMLGYTQDPADLLVSISIFIDVAVMSLFLAVILLDKACQFKHRQLQYH